VHVAGGEHTFDVGFLGARLDNEVTGSIQTRRQQG